MNENVSVDSSAAGVVVFDFIGLSESPALIVTVEFSEARWNSSLMAQVKYATGVDTC